MYNSIFKSSFILSVGLGKAQLAAVTAVDERHVRERQLLLDLLKAATKDKTLAKELATLEAQVIEI